MSSVTKQTNLVFKSKLHFSTTLSRLQGSCKKGIMGVKIRVFVLCCIMCMAYVQGQANQLAMQGAGDASSSGARPGQPQFSLQGAGAGNNGRNWAAGGNVGVGTKVWESQNGRHSVGAAVNAGQAFGRHQGMHWKTRPDYGVGAGYTYRFGGGRRG